jgi:hypothetical protein
VQPAVVQLLWPALSEQLPGTPWHDPQFDAHIEVMHA